MHLLLYTENSISKWIIFTRLIPGLKNKVKFVSYPIELSQILNDLVIKNVIK